MSNLKDLFISQSFYGIVNLENSLQPITSQSGDIELQDGIGTNLGLRTNADNKKFTVVNDLQVDGNTDLNGNLDVSGSFIHSGSIDIKGNVTVDGDISAQIATFDTVNTRLLHVTEESASVIFSSGSNVIGDEITDTQQIVGITTISGSLGVTGNQSNTGSLTVSGDISSSTLNGVGNVSDYSSSVDSRINSLSNRTGSVDSSVTALNAFTSSQLSINSGYNSFTQSIDSRFNSYTSSTDNRLDSIESFTASLQTDFVSTGSFNAYTQSTDNRLSSLETKSGSVDTSISSLNSFTQSQLTYNSGINDYTQSNDNRLTQIEIKTGSLQNEVDSLISVTGSYATTGSNTFDGDQTISGSVNGNVEVITIASQTASIDCGLGNFFTVQLPTGSATHFTATNIVPGQTISVRVATRSNTTASIDSNTIQFVNNTPYSPSQVQTHDVLTFVSFDSSRLYGVPGLFFN